MAGRSVEQTVRHVLTAGVAWITLDRPEALNAIDAEQRDRLIALLRGASADPLTRVVVLTATGRGFCTGADLRAGAAVVPGPGDVARTIRDGAQALVAAVLDCEKPVIAGVNGIAAGIGAHLALACDLVVAAESAKFIEIFARRGLVPDGGGAYLLTRLVGVHKAKELIYLAEDVPAGEALALGLVNRVVADDVLEEAVREWAERLAVGPTRAFGLAKNLVNRALEVDRATAFREEADAVELNMATEDGKEGVRAFVERRAPEFRGR
ncbi:MAG: enoyl-CoA hydratase/isomerase family protein [Catenulispora sp.]|nr:enoyl-CoA hydratase/isomerase family protein [Catenulispora sp.]